MRGVWGVILPPSFGTLSVYIQLMHSSTASSAALPQMLLHAALSPHATAALLPWKLLAEEIFAVLHDTSVQVPARIVLPLAGGGSLFCMPAADSRLAMTKLITFTPANVGTSRPTIQGDVVVFDVATGTRRLILDGPTLTARRTAAVSLLAAQRLAAQPAGPLLVIGAGAQGRAHVEAFVAGLGVREVHVASRSTHSAQALVEHARALGCEARLVSDIPLAARHCPLIVTCTPANAVVLEEAARADAFVCAVGAFTPQMVELAPSLCREFAQRGRIVVDTEDAAHEAGDLLQAGLDVARLPTLAQALHAGPAHARGAVLFKSCGWGGWDLAAARLACAQAMQVAT